MDNRRVFLKKLGSGLAISAVYFSGLNKVFANAISKKPVIFPINSNRVWLGERFWAIPMEDWRSEQDGKIVCTGEQKNSRVNVLSHQVAAGQGDFMAEVELGVAQSAGGGSAGFRIGIQDAVDNSVRSLCYYGEGLDVGISTDGYLFIGDKKNALPAGFSFEGAKLQLKVTTLQHTSDISLVASCRNGEMFTLYQKLDYDVQGMVALVNNYTQKSGNKFWFKNLRFDGNKIREHLQDNFGPVLWTMYTRSHGTLKLTAQMPPLAAEDSTQLQLHFYTNNRWEQVQSAVIEEDACTAIFRIENFTPTRDVPYKVVYRNAGETHAYEGTIRKEPASNVLKFAGLTCQEAQAYPYTPLTTNLKKHNPDMLFFSGDQIYEQNGGYPIKRFPEKESILSFLGKWYMFGWAFGDLMRDRPTICTPDDHDVFQGNLWGEGGKPVDVEDWNKKFRDAHGGYVESPRMVNAVHRVNCGHMPDCFDPEPTPSGISTWYTHLLYGGVSFAIISDRMFKSGPEAVREGTGRIDHITQPLRPAELEKKDLEFLGNRQIKFLNHWIEDWDNTQMKVLLSQTLFANVGTHHGDTKMFLYGDMDSGGWPKKQRDTVIEIIRKGYAFHINGDQHLPFIVQYSAGAVRDGGYTFCTPAISTGYIRWGDPDAEEIPHTQRPAHNLPNTGLYTDVFGNENYIYAVGNPQDKWRNKNRYLQAQNKSSGFGIISFHNAERTIKMEAFRFLSDLDQPTAQDQFAGWPHTITQEENDGRRKSFFLPGLAMNKGGQVVKITKRQGEVINVIRVPGMHYVPKVATAGYYTVKVGEGSDAKTFKNLKATARSGRKLNITI